jgi:hypothetical protein
MNKLTETDKAKEYLELCQRRMVYDESTHIIGSLLSLLEEKDKALAFYADEENYKQEMGYHDLDNKSVFYFEPPAVMDDSGLIARKALNTSSNNEGEV